MLVIVSMVIVTFDLDNVWSSAEVATLVELFKKEVRLVFYLHFEDSRLFCRW